MSKNIDFLCICVDSLNVAEMFGSMFKFKNVINGWIADRSDMPTYGQLGCQGFIIVSNNGQLISNRTSVFLQEGEIAFQKVQKILSSLNNNNNGSDESPLCSEYPYSAGCIAIIDGVSSDPTLNGMKCQVMKFNVDTGRFVVKLIVNDQDNSASFAHKKERVISVRPCSLAPNTNEEPKSGSVGGASDQSMKKSKQGDSITVDQLTSSATSSSLLSSSSSSTTTSNISQIEVPHSVGVESMDREHESCTQAINLLLKHPSNVEYFKQAMIEIKNHFLHEETLLNKYYNNKDDENNSQFSGLTSHLKDHERILNIGQNELLRATSQSSGGDEEMITPQIAVELALAFVKHAEVYDSVYENIIPVTAN